MARRALLVGGAGATGRHLASGLIASGYDVTILHRGVHEPEHLAPYRHIHADPHFGDSVVAAVGAETFDAVLLTYGRIEQLAPVFKGRCDRLVAVGGIPAYAGFADPRSRKPAGARVLASEADPAPDLFADSKAAAFVGKMIAAERSVLDVHHAGGYRASIVRYPRIYGIGNVVSQEWSVVGRVRDGRDFILLPDGGQACFTRCAAANAAHCVLLALEADAAAGEIFNCGDDEQFTLAQWVELVLEAIASTLTIVGLPQVLNHIAPHFALYGGSMFDSALVSTRKARDLLGYADVVPARTAIAECARWWLRHAATGVDGMIKRDAFDYELENRVMAALAELAAGFPRVERAGPFHSYAHPKAPALGADHHGR